MMSDGVCLLIMFLWVSSEIISLSTSVIVHSLDPKQAGQNVGRGLNPFCLHSDGIPERIFQKNLIMKKSAGDKKACNVGCIILELIF